MPLSGHSREFDSDRGRASVDGSAPANIALIGNRASGQQGAEDSAAAIAAALEALGVRAQVRLVAQGGSIAQEVQAALQAGTRIIAALGGDGTVNTVANAMRGHGEAALAIVPLGTFNYVARQYGLPTTPDAVARMLAAGITRPIPAGLIDQRIFLNNCCFGLYTHLIEARERDTRTWGRWRAVALLSAFAAALRPHARRHVIIQADNSSWIGRTSLVFAGVNPTQFDNAGMPELAEHVQQGQIGVVALRNIDAWRLIKLAWRAQTGTVTQLREIVPLAGAEVRITLRKRRLRVVLDGEVLWLRTPLVLRLIPDALRLVVPDAQQAV